MIDIIAVDSIDRLEDDVDFVEYFKSGQGLEHILFNLTDEDLERPELKEAIKKVFSIIPGAQSMEKKLGTRTLLKGIIKKFPEDSRVIDFIKVAAEIDLSYINEKIDNVSELKRVISSDKNPEEFINWLANEATALGIYWSFGDGFAYDADKSHQYKYTFVTNVSKDEVDIKRTQLASLKFHRNEQEIRLKQGVAIKLTQVLSDGSPLQLPPEVLDKTFYTSESDIEGSKMLRIEKLADLKSKKPYLLQQLDKANITGEEAERVINQANEADPTGQYAVYTQWIIKQYLRGNFKGEEDVDKFKDTLDKFTKLKNSNSIKEADINQYDSYGILAKNVKEVLDSTGGYTSNREEETSKATEGIKLLDKEGDIELYLVNTPEAASKEFRNTSWCVKDPRWFKNYADEDANFYYFKKAGEPYLLLHKNDFRNVYDDEPKEEDIKAVSKLIMKHNLPGQHLLLKYNIITNKDGKVFTNAVEQSIDNHEDFELVRDGIITEKDGEAFRKIINIALEEGNAFDLIYFDIISHEKGKDFFELAIDDLLDSINLSHKGYLQSLLSENKIPVEDTQLYNKVVDGLLEKGYAVNLVTNPGVKKDKKTLDKVIKYAIKQGSGPYMVSTNMITQEELDAYSGNTEDKEVILEKQDNQEQSDTQEGQEGIVKDEFLHIITLNKLASSEDLELSRGEIGVSLEDYDPSKDKEKSTKNRWREKPNQNTAVKPALTQESDNYKKDKLDKAKYTNFLGRTDQDKPVRVMDFATPGQYVGLDDYFTKHTDILQDDQQQYDTRNFGRGKMQPTQHSNFLYKSELLHIEQGIIKEAGKKELIQEIQGKKKISEDEADNIYNNIVSLGSNYQNDKNYYKYVRFLVNQYLNGNFNPKDPGDTAKASGGASLFLDAYNKNLLTSEKENQLRFNDFHNTLHKLLGDESGVDMSIQERTQDTDAKLLNKIKDENENVYHLFEVPTSKNVGKLFNGSSWCIRNSATASDYLKNGKAIDNQEHPFFFVTKNGEPYLLHHVLDFRQKQDMIPSAEDDNLFNSLINNTELSTEDKIANHLPLNKEEVESLDINNINDSKNQANSYKLAYIADEYAKAGKDLPDNFFDQWDGEMAYNLVKYFLNTQGEVPDFVWDKWSSWNKDYEVGSILSTYIQSGKQEKIPEFLLDREEYYSDSITTFLQAGLEVPENIWEHWATDKNDNGVEVFRWYYNPNHKNKIQDGLLDKINEHYQGSTLDILVEDKKEPFLDSKTKDALINQELKKGYDLYLLKNKIITKADGELYNQVVNNAIEEGDGYYLLKNKIITREDGELYNQLVNNEIEGGDRYYLLIDEVITKEDGELFNQVVNNAIKEGHGYGLLNNKIITREDGDLFYQAVNQAIKEGYGYYLLKNKIITREDGELFNKAVNQAIEKGHDYYLLKNKYITREDGELFNKLLNSTIEKDNAHVLFRDKIITREDGELFNKAVNQAIEKGFGYDLLNNKIITREDGELFNKAVNQAIESAWVYDLNSTTEKGKGDILVENNIITQEELDNITNNQGKTQETNEEPETEEQQEQDINKMELLHITTIQRIAAEAKDSAGETSITPTVTDNVVDQITQKPTDNVTQGKGGGKPVKGTKRGGTGTRPVKALYTTNLKGIDIIADQFGDWTTRTELPESALKRFRGQDANEKNEKENKDLKKKMKGKPNKPLHNVPKKDVYAWGNDDLNGGALFFSDLSLPQMGDLSEMN